MPFVDDFALFADGFDATMLLKDKTFSLLLSLGLHIHETKGHHVATQVGDHVGMTLDVKCGVFRSPIEKLKGIAKLVIHLLYIAVANKMWVNVKTMASLAGRARFLHLAIPVAKFFLRELHDIVSSAKFWTGIVRLTCQLKRDLEWWRVVQSKHSGAPI